MHYLYQILNVFLFKSILKYTDDLQVPANQMYAVT